LDVCSHFVATTVLQWQKLDNLANCYPKGFLMGRWQSFFCIALIVALLVGMAGGQVAQAAPHGQSDPTPWPTDEPLHTASGPQPIDYPFPIYGPTGEPPHHAPAVAYNPERKEYLVVWHNERSVYPDIQAQRISWDGTAPVGSAFFVSGGQGAKRRYADVVYNEAQHEYLVVWQHEADGALPDIHARRVSGNGQLLGNEIALGTGAALRLRTAPAVAYASTSNKYMVVWESYVQGALSSDIEAQIVSPSGALEGSNFMVANGDNSNSNSDPDIAYNRSRNEYLVVWNWYDKVAKNYDIKARIVTRDGLLLGSELLVGYYGDGYDPAVTGMPTAPNAGYYLVVWRIDYGANDTNIFGREVMGDGKMEPLFAVEWTPDNGARPAVTAREGLGNYFVAWEQVDSAKTRDIAARLATGYAAKDPYFSLAGTVSGAKHAATATGEYGTVLTVFESTTLGSDDIWGRMFGDVHSVNVTVTQGGNVSSSPSGITCSPTCSAEFLANSTVKLTAIVQAGWEFTGWGGACSGTALDCQLTVDGAKSVSATFAERKWTLQVTKTGQGMVSSSPPGINCGSDCSDEYTVGTTVTLSAQPQTGWLFKEWGQACSGTAPTCQVSGNGLKLVSATFERPKLLLPCLMR
jgi:hypothetical protein